MPISLSTLADQVGGCTVALTPLFRRLEAHVLSAERLHGDDTTVPVLAKGKTDTGRIWVYVRDDKPFGGQAPPGAVFYYSRDRAGEHPQAHLAGYSGIFQADAYGFRYLFHWYLLSMRGVVALRTRLSLRLSCRCQTWKNSAQDHAIGETRLG